MMVYASLLAALTAAGAYISIPIGDVPVVLHNFFILLMGLLLGMRWATASITVYLLAGTLGLPVFAGGKGGLAILMGPTGGYLVGFLPAVAIIGFLSEKLNRRFICDIIAMCTGSAVIYAFGVARLKMLTGRTWVETFAIGVVPFITFDVVKIFAAAATAKAIRTVMKTS
jgi:biotin transport system substrate-specific component